MKDIQENGSTTVVRQSVIPPEVIQELSQGLERLNELIRPYGTVVSVNQKRRLSKMGIKNTGFVERAAQYSVSNPEFLSAYMDGDEFRGHVENSRNLLSIRTKAKVLFDTINDTFVTEGSKAFQSARVYYGNTQTARRDSIPNAVPINEDLEKRYHRSRKKLKGGVEDIAFDTAPDNSLMS
jgi:hypothetical protein